MRASPTSLMARLNRLVEVSVTDPDDARRRRLLNIIISGIGLGALMLLLATALVELSPNRGPAGARLYIYIVGTVIFLFTVVIFLLNRSRRIPSVVTSSLFLVFLLTAITFSDKPMEVAQGRTLFVFTIPIVIASVLLTPFSSFIFAALSSLVVWLIALYLGIVANMPAVLGFFTLAMVSWLSSRSLEQALKDLRLTNANLDKLVAERTQALAEALAQQRAEAGRRQAILNSIADGVIVYDVNGRPILANPAIHLLLELPVEQILTRSFDELAHTPELSLRDQSLLQTIMDSKTRPSSFRIQWGKKTLSVSAAQVYGAETEEIGTVAVFRDISRDVELERMKSSFIATVSHELRTPLSSIMGFAEMMREGVCGLLTEQQAFASERILSNSRHMLGMVSDLLDQAQIEAGKLRINSEPFKPVDLLNTVRDIMGPIVSEKGLALTGEVDHVLPELLIGDCQRLQQILMNLVTNAVKFTDEGSIHVGLYLSGPRTWILRVRDTGRGIPEDALERVFEPFHQVASTTTRDQRGFGLGLSIVKQLVQLMNGDVEVKSKLGMGSTFTITLPLIEEDTERKQTMPPAALIVEDDPDLASIFAEALKSAGFETQVIGDGALAQRRIRELRPQIIILDLHLPHVDGSTLLSQIRSDPVLKGTIVIVATADAVMGEVYRDTADIVLIKPISFVQLRDLSARLRTVQLGSSTA